MIDLNSIPTLPPEDADKEACIQHLEALNERLFELQNVFYADGRFGLLVVLQGMDTSGKGGVVRKVMSSMSPMGLRVKAFTKPTEEEQSHDFLWRIYSHIPPKGMIQVFDRSYYEDIIMPQILGTHTEDELKYRYQLISDLENHWMKSNIHVLKFFLHISKEEQAERIEDRLAKPHKRWKYSKDDHHAANEWDKYQTIYDHMMNACSEPQWHIIPSDKRWYRNVKVAEVLIEHLEGLDLKYPSEV